MNLLYSLTANNDFNYYLSKYLENYPYIIPLGFIGIWRWFVWLIKKAVTVFYQPYVKEVKKTVSVITPVYNENPIIFQKAIISWLKNKPLEIIAVIDYTDVSCINLFKNLQKKFSILKLIITKTPGKREALYDGIKIAKGEVLALVDSDTIWEKNVLKECLKPFVDKKIGGVTTKQAVIKPQTLAQKLFSIRLELRYWDEIPFTSTASKMLACLSGRTSFYRREAILPIAHLMVNEIFFGKKVISGEDKRLTYLIEKQGWQTYYQNTATVLTYGAANLKTMIKQQIRWTRNSWRNDLRALYERWPFKNLIFSLYLIDRAIQPFTMVIAPIYFFIALIFRQWLVVIVILIWWLFSRGIKMIPHLKKHPYDISVLPLYVIYSFITGYIRLYSLATIHHQGWITRWHKSRLNKFSFLSVSLPHLFVVFYLLILFFRISYQEFRAEIFPKIKESKFQARLFKPTNNFLARNLNQSNQVLGISDKNINYWRVKRYVVKENDNIYQIANYFKIPVEKIIQANAAKIPNINQINPGIILTIPSPDFEFIDKSKFNNQIIKPIPLFIYYDFVSDQIVVAGRGHIVDLPMIKNALNDNNLIEESNNKIWQLKKSIYLVSGVTLKIDGNQVKWLRLLSDKKKFIRIMGFNSDLIIENTKITSWNMENNDYDRDWTDGRAYILIKDNSRMDIFNSEIAYLGFSRSANITISPYGISWRMSNSKLKKDIITGEVYDSRFHDNYFGIYTFGAVGMNWKNNLFYNNYRYGFDPHDDSNGFLVENNQFYNNGSHGLIFSKRCQFNTIINNRSYNNQLHGFMLHELSNNNVIANNILNNNGSDGISLDRSSNNLIRNNHIMGNKRGLVIDRSSLNNFIAGNKIDNNTQYGFYLYNMSTNNTISANQLINNPVALYIKTSYNDVTRNIIDKNQIGIYIYGKSNQNKIVDNEIKYNLISGLYSKVYGNLTVYLTNNRILKNKKDVHSIEISLDE